MREWVAILFIMVGGSAFAGWTSVVVDDGSQTYGGPVKERASMLAVAGNPAIAAGDAERRSLIYRRALDANGDMWGPWITLDRDGHPAWDPVLIIADGHPAIAYCALEEGEVRFVRALDSEGSIWGDPISITTADLYIDAYEDRLSAAVIAGRPAITYSNNGDIWFSISEDAIGSTWSNSILIHNGPYVWGGEPMLMELGGVPCVAITVQQFQGSLPYANGIRLYRAADATGSSWLAPQMLHSDSGTLSGSWNLTHAMIGGKPAVCYMRPVYHSGEIFLTRSEDSAGTTWTIPSRIPSELTEGYSPVIHANNGKPAISWLDENLEGYAYIIADNAEGSIWGLPVEIPLLDNAYRTLGLQMINGHPTVLVSGSTMQYCRALDAEGSAWGNPITHTANGSFFASSVSMVSIQGMAMLAYSDGWNEGLKFVASSDSTGSTWDDPRTISGMDRNVPWCSLAEIGEKPAIAYKGSGTEGLRFIAAADPEGDVWNASVSIKTGQYAGREARLHEANGRPAVAFIDGSSEHLYYARAANSVGSTWQAPVAIDTYLGEKKGVAAKIIEGNPAVAYYFDSSTGYIRYCRAGNADGTSWSVPSTVESGVGYNLSTALAIVAGKPSVAYYRNTDDALRVQHALNAEGTVWSGSPITLASPVMGSPVGMELLDGKPIVAYGDRANSQVKVIRASNAEGTAWEASEIVAESAQPCAGQHLVIHNGQPMIAYYDLQELDLRVAVFQPPTFDDAVHLSDTIPSLAGTEHAFEFGITLLNGGNAVWSGASGCRLKKTQDTCGVVTEDYLELPSGLTVSPGESVVIKGVIHAPAAEGMCDLTFQMVRDGTTLSSESETAFGLVISRTVQFVAFVNDASFPSHFIPASLAPNQGVYIGVQARNEGNTQWNIEDYRLSVVSDACSLIQAPSLAIAETVSPNRSSMFTFFVTAAPIEGNCEIQLRMEETGVGPFGTVFSHTVPIVTPENAVLNWANYE